jgi:drug/metabolite transporter (DMT)-like permease
MLASVLSFTLEAALIKSAGSVFTPVEILFWRQAVAVALLAPLILRAPRATLSTSLPGTIIFRSVIGVLGIVMSISALSLLPLADATTLSFTRVLWIVLIAALVMKEAMGPRRIVAVIVGFVGVAVLMKPGSDVFAVGWPHLTALGAALFAALSILSVKRLTRDHSVLTISAYGSGLGLLLSIPFVVTDFRVPEWDQLPVLLGLGAAGLCTLVCYTRGMQLGEAVAMAPIDYLRLVLAAGVGLLIFNEPLSPWLAAGAALIILANLSLTGPFARQS